MKHVRPEYLFKPGNYTPAVTFSGGTHIVISGQVAWDESGQIVGIGDLKAQTAQVFKNMKTVLLASGATFDDLVKVTTYVVNYQPHMRETLIAVASEFFNMENPPVSTLVGVQALSEPDLLIEIEGWAVIE